MAIAATEALVADAQQSLDSHAWWRQDWSELQQKADGLTLDAQGLSPFITTMAKFIPDGSRQQNDQIFVQNMQEIIVPTAAAFGIMAVRDGMDNAQRLDCGRDWQRIHLWGATQGLAFQPLNQMCEQADRERQLGMPSPYSALPCVGWWATMAGRPSCRSAWAIRRKLGSRARAAASRMCWCRMEHYE